MRQPVPVVPDGRKIDGRSLRAVRTRQLVAETFLDLLGEGVAHPTAQQISDRSGVSMSSIFRLFEDVEAVQRASITTQFERVSHLIVDPDPVGPLERRVRSLIATRSKLLEAIAPVRRVAVRLAATSEPIRADLAVSDEFFRTQLVILFDEELSALSPSARLDALDIVDAATSWETWERFRNSEGVSEQRTRRLVTAMVLGALSAR